jgi:hypothetical protein
MEKTGVHTTEMYWSNGRFWVVIVEQQRVAVTKKGKRKGSFHVHVELPGKEKAEIKIVPASEVSKKEKCEIHGGEITGLCIRELEKLLIENPAQRFVPS